MLTKAEKEEFKFQGYCGLCWMYFRKGPTNIPSCANAQLWVGKEHVKKLPDFKSYQHAQPIDINLLAKCKLTGMRRLI